MIARSVNFPRLRSPARRWDWAVARTLRDLDWSIRHGRMMSLPNLLRLYRRRIGPSVGLNDQSARDREDRYLALLRKHHAGT